MRFCVSHVLSMVSQDSNPNTENVEQDQGSKVLHSCRVSSRPAWATPDPVSKTKQKTRMLISRLFINEYSGYWQFRDLSNELNHETLVVHSLSLIVRMQATNCEQ